MVIDIEIKANIIFKTVKGISLSLLYEEYCNGMSIPDLALKYGIQHQGTIWQAFKNNSLPTRNMKEAQQLRHKNLRKHQIWKDKINNAEKPIYISKEQIWNLLLLLNKEALEFIYKDKNDWDNYCKLQNTSLWAVGVELRRIYEGNPKGAFHHEGRPYATKVYPCVFTAKDAWFEENHKKGRMNNAKI